MGRKKKTPGQVSSSSTPGTSEKVDTATKSQVLSDTLEKLNGTVTIEQHSEAVEKSHIEEAQTRWKGFTGQSCIFEKGTGLKFVAPVIVNGDFIAKLHKVDVETQT